ncbi:GON-4-like protein isoform X2 [Argiope bruennichi]|uniref:GON-4-like protein isoform X1 n=1 Tax=Argiope bruennichi TaxID=94029 RepID=UPI0024946F5E|nr:GON-4-like protein isoform X1 [Argiope bruennichi]XP_055930602.1 GON-4-like protein isoform X2 [Argiope bruennichi]
MMAEKVYIENVSSISNADENWMFTSGRKRKLTSIDRSIEMVSPENVTKRLKLEENTEISDVEMDKNEKKVLGNKSEMIDTINTRTYSRKKLTAENLKTILRYLLANNSVLTMVQNSLKSQKENKSQLETKDQPISKVPAAKEINKSLWPALTPKKPDDVSKKLLEEEYSEESASDEDYQPNEEELSDEDAMSSVKVDDLNASKMDEHILPDSKPPDQLSDDEDALVIALPETDVSHDKEVDKIAQRTRSKLCLNDTPLETIESSFQPPDITIDMYDTHCDDAVWKEFLCEFTKPLTQGSGVGSVADDTEDERDPEYNVQEEEEDEDEEIDYDEICGENPLEVTGDEVNALMTEILEFAQEDKSLLEQDFSFLEELSVAFSGNEKNSNDIQKEGSQDVSEKEKNENVSKLENCCNNLETVIDSKDSNEKDNFNKSGEQEVIESQSENAPHSNTDVPSSPVKVENVRKEWMIPDERRQLEEQMRMYVQMLTQSYLLSHGFSSLHFINASSRFFLYEIKILASRGTPNNQRSAFYAHNLDDAIDIVSKFENLAEPEKAKKRKMNKGIPEYVKKALASSKAFIYPELLPTFGFYTFYRGSKASFSAAEDNLIALGLEQFSYMEDPLECIQKFLLPTKSRYQIKCRIKNSKQKRDTENPIAYYCKYKKLPEFNRVIRIFDPNNVKAPEEYPPSALPAWMEPYSGESLQKRIMEKQRIQDKRPKLILPRMQLAPTIIHEYHPPDPQGILQPMICKVYSVNENNVSNGNSGIILPKRITRKRKRLAKYQVNKSTQYPELPEVSSNSCVSQTIKQEPLSEGTSDEESIENENNSDSSSECSFNLKNPITKKIYSLRKRTVATKSMSTNHETCQTEISLSATTQTFNPVSVKEEPSSSESSNEVHNENNSSHKKHDQLHVEHSALTEPSLRIVTSHGDESSDSDEDNVICNELLEPIQKFYCGINEDAVLPPASNSVQKRLPSDFSTIRDIICSEEKRKKDLNTCKNKVRSKKPGKSKKNWSTEEDQLIISNCQKYGINKRAFRVSADEIGSITPIKVKQRFICLLKLLSEKLKNGSENH